MDPRARADFHCHSSASFDGEVDPVRLLELARDRGLTHLAITDHETIAGFIVARDADVPGITLIPAQEVRTIEGDLILLFIQRSVAAGLSVEETVGLAREQGAVIGLAHPFDVYRPSVGRGAVRPADLVRLAELVDYVEVHNGRIRDQVAHARAADFARDHGLPQVAVSDAHTEREVGRSTTLLDGDIATAHELLAALRRGPTLRVRETANAQAEEDEGSLDRLRRRFRTAG